MRLSFGRLGFALCLAFAWFSACGGATDRRGRALEVAGDAGQPAGPETGGRGVQPGLGGEPGVSEQAGQGGQLGFGGAFAAGAPAVPVGAAGQPASGSGGEPSGGGEPGGGASADAGGAGGVGGGADAGAGGAPLECCEPLTCPDMLDDGFECAQNPFRDGCGRSFFCGCSAGDECVANQCVPCDAGPDPCLANPNLCGATSDRCGHAITCADNCATLLGPLGTCHGGQCCEIQKTTCDDDDCGYMSDGCGSFIDCTDSICAEGTCQQNGKCCTPNESCLPGDCGYKPDGCGNYLDCADACLEDEVCLDNHCHPSVCKPFDLECGSVYNPAVDGFEFCGDTCGASGACLEHLCVPLCSSLVE